MAAAADADVVTAVKQLCHKRSKGWAYLVRMHEGGSYWLNTVELTRDEVCSFYAKTMKSSESTKRSEAWYHLGINIGSLLRRHSENNMGLAWLSSLHTLLVEFESALKHKKTPPGAEYVDMCNIPVSLDYVQVIYALAQLLKMTYDTCHELDGAQWSLEMARMLSQVDQTLCSLVQHTIVKDLNQLSRMVMKSHLNSVDALFEAIERPQAMDQFSRIEEDDDDSRSSSSQIATSAGNSPMNSKG